MSGLEKQPTTANSLDHGFTNNAEINCRPGRLGTLWSLVRIKTAHYAGRMQGEPREPTRSIYPRAWDGKAATSLRLGRFLPDNTIGDVSDVSDVDLECKE